MAPRRWPLAARSWHLAPSPRQIAARLWQPAFLVALALWTTPAAADPAVPVDVRVGNHPGFGRLVVEFDVRMAYHESREGDHLTLRFDNDVDFTPPAYPPHNIGAVSVGHNLLDLTLHAGVTTHVSWFGDRLVVDVFDPVDTATGEVPLAVLASGGLPGTASPTDASEADASPIGVAPLRAAWHRGGRPLPLPPPPAPPPPIAPGTEASAPASQSVAPAPPIPSVTPTPTPSSTALLPAASSPAPAAPAPAAPAASSPAPAAPAPASPQASPPNSALPRAAAGAVPGATPGTSPSAPASQTARASDQPVPPVQAAIPAPALGAAAMPAAPSGPIASAPSGPISSAPSGPTASPPPGPISLAATKANPPKQTTSVLYLPFPSTVGVAAFRRGGTALVVFDERRPVDLAGLRNDPVFGAATIQLLPAATVLRLPLPANRSLVISQTPQSWRVGVIDAAPPIRPIPIRAEDGHLSLPADAVGEVVALTDPETGATLLVGTQLTAGQGMPTPRETPEFDLLATWQGVAIVPLADQLVMRAVNDGFLVTGGKQGLAMAPSTAAIQAQTDAAGMTRRFDLRDQPTETLLHRLAGQVAAAALAAPLERGPLRMAAAETMLALGLGAEAQAMLSLATTDDPAMGESADAIGLSAIAALLAGRITEADGIEDPRLTGSDEVTLWRAVRAAEKAPGSPLAATGFAATVPLIAVYPAALRQRLLPLAFETMIEGGQTAAAAQLLTHQKDDNPALALARAMLCEANGDTDGALAIYDKLAGGRDQLAHARAAVRAVELRLRAGRIDTAHAADALDQLLYAWRGGRRELALRERVADLREQTGHWRAALAMLHETEALFPDDKDAVHARLKAAFARLLHDDALDRLAPLELVALIDENADLLPNGPEGEAMEERLADRLVALELPARAAPVLAKLMAAAPSPAGRAGFGARLAQLRLRENDASGALAALTTSADRSLVAPLPALLIERRTLLAAAARARLGDTARAVADLAALGTPAADLARASILEKTKDWPGAEHALASYITKTEPPTGALDETQQRTVVRYATAAAQAGDDATLALLRTTDGPRMPGGAFGDMFRLLTAEPVHVSADLPRAGRETALARELPKALDALGPRTATP